MLLALALALVAPDPETPPLWGDLDPGRHAVGFRSRELRDLSRPGIGADAFAAQAVELGGDSLAIRAGLPELRSLRTAAIRAARPAPGAPSSALPPLLPRAVHAVAMC